MNYIIRFFGGVYWLLGRFFGFFLIVLFRFYRIFLSPLLGSNCRFHPTCSRYGLEAVRKYGAFKGGWLTIRRIFRCHPWGGHGHDPVP